MFSYLFLFIFQRTTPQPAKQPKMGWEAAMPNVDRWDETPYRNKGEKKGGRLMCDIFLLLLYGGHDSVIS